MMSVFSRLNRNLNLNLIARVIGVLIWVEGGLLLLSTFVSLYYHETCYKDFLYSFCVHLIIGGILFLSGKGAKPYLSKRDGYAVVGLTWLSFTLLGMLPFIFSGSIPSVTNAFFETMSGFTTTGATILDDIEALPHGMLFWRSIIQWIGGLGMICFTIALLPVFGQGNLQLFSAEATGVFQNKIQPKISMMTKWIWIIYIVLTAILAGLLLIGGMDLFDAVCHSLTTTATGGYSTKQASIAYWNSPFIEYVISVFMILSSISFPLYFFLLQGRLKRVFYDNELRWFLGSLLIIVLIITSALYFQRGYNLEWAFRSALFQVSSLHSSTGYATDDYLLWPSFTMMLLLFAMLAGGCTGSTGGGIKNLRILILFRSIMAQFKQNLHPNAVIPLRLNDHVVPMSKINGVFTFVGLYFLCGFVGSTSLMILGVGFTESITTVISSLGNVGPAFGAYGPMFTWNSMPDMAKWISAFLMLVGRLELFSILTVFTPYFWHD